MPCLYWSLHCARRDWIGLLKPFLLRCEDAVGAGRSCVCCSCVHQSSSDWAVVPGQELLWLPLEGAALCTCPGGVSPGSSESPWGAALPWSTSTPLPSLGVSGRVSWVSSLSSSNTSKRKIPSTAPLVPGTEWPVHPSSLSLVIQNNRQTENKVQLGKCKLWSASQLSLLHPQSWELWEPGHCPCASPPAMPALLAPFLWESLLDLWQYVDGPLHSVRTSGYFPNVN